MGNTRGASTIVMQNAKKILGNTQRSLSNKLEEIIISYLMVSKFGKEENLDFYINTVPVGANIYGLPAAAANYFKKDLNELNLQQLVAIGSFIPNHNRQIAFYEIINGKGLDELDEELRYHARGGINKVNLALAYLRDHGEISAERFDHWRLTDEESIRRIGFRDFRSPLYGEEEWTSWNVIKEVTSRTYKIHGREVSGTQLILDEKGDVVIETAVDLALVEKIKAVISEFLGSSSYQKVLQKSNQKSWEQDLDRYLSRNATPPYEDFAEFMEYLNRHINVGVIIVNQQGEIIAYVGGKEFLQSENGDGDQDSKNSPGVIIDLMNKQAKITPSSTIKPIIAYYAMVENNLKLNDTFADKPLEYKYSASAGREIWLPGNWYDYDGRGMGNNRYLGRNYSLFDAQVISINTIFARLYTDRKLRNAMLLDFDELGLEYNREDARYWPFGIGASDVPVQQWLGIYNAFLDGNYRPPAFVNRITINGEVIYTRREDPAKEPIPLFDAKKEREDEMGVLYEVCNSGTGAAMKSEFKYHLNLVSGKTGTAPQGKSSLFISHFNPYRDRSSYSDKTLTMIVATTTNSGGIKNVGSAAQGPVKVAGRIYDYLFNLELQEMMDRKLEKAKHENPHFRNNHIYWANVNRYMDHLLNKTCGQDYIYRNIVGVESYAEALNQILNSTNKIYTGRDQLFYQLVQYYCDQEKVVKITSPGNEPTDSAEQTP
jgi:membrane peptidoglycan carboxypeptidase